MIVFQSASAFPGRLVLGNHRETTCSNRRAADLPAAGTGDADNRFIAIITGNRKSVTLRRDHFRGKNSRSRLIIAKYLDMRFDNV